MLQIEGALLNHKPYLEMTNLIGDTLDDIWEHAEIPRAQYKAVATPSLYGSTQPAQYFWAKKFNYTNSQVKAYNYDISHGKLALAEKFKNYIIRNVKPQENMRVKIWNEEFDISCNHFRNVGDYTKKYNIYDTASNSIKTVYHTHTHKEADLEAFRRYFVTLLNHNLDSQTAEEIALVVDWIIAIYDAFITHPSDVELVKSTYTRKIKEINRDRQTILKEYFRSIGIDHTSLGMWADVLAHIEPLEEEFIPQGTALK